MRNLSLATGEKNRLSVRRKASSLRDPSPGLRAAKIAGAVQEVFAPKGQVEDEGGSRAGCHLGFVPFR